MSVENLAQHVNRVDAYRIGAPRNRWGELRRRFCGTATLTGPSGVPVPQGATDSASASFVALESSCSGVSSYSPATFPRGPREDEKRDDPLRRGRTEILVVCGFPPQPPFSSTELRCSMASRWPEFHTPLERLLVLTPLPRRQARTPVNAPSPWCSVLATVARFNDRLLCHVSPVGHNGRLTGSPGARKVRRSAGFFSGRARKQQAFALAHVAPVRLDLFLQLWIAQWKVLFTLLAILSMTLGNVVALGSAAR